MDNWTLPKMRQRLTARLFTWFRGVLPRMSQTEKEAIEAGETWWEKDLFQGKPHWDALLAFPKAVLDEHEQAFLNNQVETLCAMLNDWQIVHEKADLPADVWDYLKKEKFFGMRIPVNYGGLGFSQAAHSSVIVKIATRCASAAVTVMVPNALGPAELLLHYGSQAQKDHYLPRLADGRDLPCFGLTGPEAGSDAGAIPDTGIIEYGLFEGKEILGIRLNFDKRYITLAPVATVVGLAVKLFDPSHLLGTQTALGITLCLIPANHPGVEIGNRHFPLNMAFMNGPIRGKEVFIPLAWIIGGVDNAGKGWRMLMECLSAGRGISLPALSAATGMLCYRMTGAYAAIRQQFNMPIGAFEGVEEALARIGGFSYLLEATRCFTVAAIDQDIKPAIATAIAKYHMTEIARKVINDAMDIHGGRGIMQGPFNYLARIYQSLPISITVEGANILTRSLMIFGQGAIRCHPFARAEMEAAALYAQDPDEATHQFDMTVRKHILYILANVGRVFKLAFSGGYFSRSIPQKTGHYVKKINYLSAVLAFSSDLAMGILGGELKRKEKLSARLGDILSYLYLASALIKHYHDEGEPQSYWPHAQWSLEYCLYQAQEAFYGLCQNFPNPALGFILRLVCFPYGRIFSLPKDSLGKKIAQAMLSPALSDSFTGLCYVGKTSDDPTGLMEITFNQLTALEPVFQKIHQGIAAKILPKKLAFEELIAQALEKQVLTRAEVDKLESFESLRKQAIAVDEFSQDYALRASQKGDKANNHAKHD